MRVGGAVSVGVWECGRRWTRTRRGLARGDDDTHDLLPVGSYGAAVLKNRR